ncbi:MAG: hypothetical protein B6241_10070 [Spirochaetaceae bacterium 4572_59]|nr:MAG: hypothetical protein B6241_10070 [Spirochaetaceae bacterium 4572_59]
MPRPSTQKTICRMPEVSVFKPAGIHISAREKIILTLEEFESIRLADKLGLYQDKAAESMGTSRQTFARILDSAHKKVATALVESRPLVIEGGNVKFCTKDSCHTHPGCSTRDSEGKV